MMLEALLVEYDLLQENHGNWLQGSGQCGKTWKEQELISEKEAVGIMTPKMEELAKKKRKKEKKK